jgi:hypothetical protein
MRANHPAIKPRRAMHTGAYRSMMRGSFILSSELKDIHPK